MTITAEWIRNKDEFPWELVRAATGTTGLRTYLVNTDLVDKALTAAGLPAIDDAWDGLDFADLTVVQVGPAKVLGGKDISGNGDGGWCAVPVRYATPTRALAVFPQPGLKWTEIASGLEAFTGYFPLKRKTGPDPNTPNIDVPGPYQPSNNDDSFPVKQTTYSTRVHVYLKPDASYNAEALGLNDMEYFKPSKTLVVGRSYTVNELLERMIVYSDNDAVPLLLQTIDQKIFDEVFTDLGITIPGNASETLTDYMTVKTYANFFRVLNNASYLNRQTSEKALELLSRSDFASGIRAGVPVGTMVAQKFGERVFDVNPLSHKSQKELHDCGIVYFPQHPYLLCVMTKGTDFSKLEESIKTISQAVYASIQEENAQK
jgi:hypothetical protein